MCTAQPAHTWAPNRSYRLPNTSSPSTRLKRWRFGSSSESLEASTQAVLFDQILADTALEDRAARDEIKAPPAAPRTKGQAVRQALPDHLRRVEHRHEPQDTTRSVPDRVARRGPGWAKLAQHAGAR